MPALITHYLCGKMVLELLPNNGLRSTIIENRSAFNLGTQGPDIFYYYGAWPLSKDKVLSRLGDIMHEQKTGAFILGALKYISAAEEPARSILTAYICGFVCHYVLDCHTHPYIFYKTGFVRKGEAPADKYTCYHRMFETALDVLMLKDKLGIKPSSFNAASQLRLTAPASAEISKMYSRVLRAVYEMETEITHISDALSCISNISALLRDRTGIKKKLVAAVEKMLGKPPMSSSMILPDEINDGLDYLNTSHDIWHLPWDNTIALTSSFTENFEAAAAESKETIEMLGLFQSGKLKLEDLSAAIGSRSYSTGRDCGLEMEFKYFDCIYELPDANNRTSDSTYIL